VSHRITCHAKDHAKIQINHLRTCHPRHFLSFANSLFGREVESLAVAAKDVPPAYVPGRGVAENIWEPVSKKIKKNLGAGTGRHWTSFLVIIELQKCNDPLRPCHTRRIAAER
jgi:hypothetical protein